jgi:hypothetical protein
VRHERSPFHILRTVAWGGMNLLAVLSLLPAEEMVRTSLGGHIAEHDATNQDHLRQVAQGELVAQAPEHHEGDDVRRILCPVQHATTALVELLAAGAAPKPPVTLGGALAPL